MRYLHDPNATQPVISQQLQSVDLRVLIDKIDKGLIFHHAYIGTKQIREASVNIHNIFRLSERDSFPVALFSELPLDSSQGLDSFLTVITKFPPCIPRLEICQALLLSTHRVFGHIDTLSQVTTIDAMNVCHLHCLYNP